MFGPGWEEGCRSCSYLADHIDGALPHLNARGLTLAAVSRAPLTQLQPFKARMGWKFPWASSHDSDFNFDFQVSASEDDLARGEMEYNFSRGPAVLTELPGLSAFYKDDTGIYHTYSGYGRGLDILIGSYNYLDMAPLGRDEDGLAFSMAWVRHHDQYGPGYAVDPKATYQTPKVAACAGCGCSSPS
jgi:predicted dithiol-disulfide oxidoreductase (DUF899 family)